MKSVASLLPGNHLSTYLQMDIFLKEDCVQGTGRQLPVSPPNDGLSWPCSSVCIWTSRSFSSTDGMASPGADTALVGLGNLSGAEQT